MALYTVLEPPDGKADRVAFIAEGFSWPALVFTVAWALWHRMWVVALLLAAALAAPSLAEAHGLVDGGLALLLQAALALLFGFEARRLRVTSLERVGFRPAGLIAASELEAAEHAYFTIRQPAVPVAPTRYAAGPEDTLGLFGKV